MKQCMLILLGVAVTNICAAESSNNFNVKADVIIKNIHGVVQSGTWFNLALSNNVTASIGSQKFTAVVTEPIYNKDFSEVLIPAQTMVSGTYLNDGKTCSFGIETISLKDAEIDLLPGAYTKVNASLLNQPECNPEINYVPSQLLEFQTKVDIEGLTPVTYNKDYYIKDSQDNFVQTYGNSDYAISSINRYTNGLLKVSVKFFDNSLKGKLIPVYFDEFGVSHPLNFNMVTTEDKPFDNLNNTYSYMFSSAHPKFGFGIWEE